MSDAPPGSRPVNFQLNVPNEQEVGVYANVCAVWWTPHDFVLDFGVTGRPELSGEDVSVPTRVVSRIRLPTGLIQDLLTAISIEVAKYESAAGPIRRPNEDAPLFPPEDL